MILAINKQVFWQQVFWLMTKRKRDSGVETKQYRLLQKRMHQNYIE